MKELHVVEPLRDQIAIVLEILLAQLLLLLHPSQLLNQVSTPLIYKHGRLQLKMELG